MKLLSETFKTRTALGAAVFFWASAFVGIRAGLQSYHPGSLALLRYLVASVCMVFFFFRLKRHIKPTRKIILKTMLLGTVGIGMYNIFLNYGERTVPAGIAGFVGAQMPVITTVLALFILKETLRFRNWMGIAISIIGVLLIALGESQNFEFDIGVVFLFLSALSGSIYCVFQKPVLKRCCSMEFTCYAIWAATLFLMYYFPQLLSDLPHAPLHDTLWVIYLGVFPACIGYATWNYASSRIPASQAASALYAMPVIATLLGWLILDEIPATLSLIGGLIALCGAYLVGQRPKVKALIEEDIPR